MMSKSHYWLVCDAVDFIKHHGDAVQKAALQTFQIAYGNKAAVQDVPTERTALAQLAGFEARHTDKFGDLTISLRALPRGGKRSVTGIGYHMFTAFNHFLNPYPDSDHPWPGPGGYSFESSSRKGFDSLVILGISKCLHGLVDLADSPVLDRAKPFFRNDEAGWAENFGHSLSQTEFAPWTVLVNVYYELFLKNHYDPLEVRGPNRFIVGLQVLGPVLHAIADACSVQHVRSTLGFGHSVWENYLKSKVYNHQIIPNPGHVRGFFREEPFATVKRSSDGPLEGRFDIAHFVDRLSLKTADRLQYSTRMNWQRLWKAEGKFWRSYLIGNAMREDAEYLYNMAVAGTVHMIVQAYYDLMLEDIISPCEGLKNPEKMPPLELVQNQKGYVGPPTRKGVKDVPPEDYMPPGGAKAEDLLGFSPIGATELHVQIKEADRLYADGCPRNRDGALGLLRGMEQALIEQYRRMDMKLANGFVPFTALERIPIESDLSAHFGIGTFRLPSEKEYSDTEGLSGYIDKSDAHAYKAHKVALTQAVASLRFMAQQAGEEAWAARYEYLAGEVERLRDADFADFAESSVGELITAKAAEADSRQGFLSRAMDAVRDRLSFLFEIPMTALATAAAAALLVVLIYPRGVQEEILAISGEQWVTDAPAPVAPVQRKLRLMGPGDPESELVPKSVDVGPGARIRAAILIRFKKFGKEPPEDLVSLSYRAAAPTEAIRKHYELLSPDKLREATAKGGVKTTDPKQTLHSLRTNLDVEKALLVTLTSAGALVDVEAQWTDLDSGEHKPLPSRFGVSRDELAKVLRQTVESAFQTP